MNVSAGEESCIEYQDIGECSNITLNHFVNIKGSEIKLNSNIFSSAVFMCANDISLSKNSLISSDGLGCGAISGRGKGIYYDNYGYGSGGSFSGLGGNNTTLSGTLTYDPGSNLAFGSGGGFGSYSECSYRSGGGMILLRSSSSL